MNTYEHLGNRFSSKFSLSVQTLAGDVQRKWVEDGTQLRVSFYKMKEEELNGKAEAAKFFAFSLIYRKKKKTP